MKSSSKRPADSQTFIGSFPIEFLSTKRPLNEIDSAECAAWIQTGLALTPFAGCVIKHTCDWTIAWSLIGEWTSQEIFLPPVGEWPRNGHSRNLFFFLIAGCIGSLGYWQSLATRESKTQHQWYCIPKESQVPIHYDLRHHNLCMTWRMVH